MDKDDEGFDRFSMDVANIIISDMQEFVNNILDINNCLTVVINEKKFKIRLEPDND